MFRASLSEKLIGFNQAAANQAVSETPESAEVMVEWGGPFRGWSDGAPWPGI